MKKVILGLFTIIFFVFATTATAKNVLGNNGTVKIEQIGGNTPEISNEPHVRCGFFLEFFFADQNQSGDWEIQSWPPTGTRTVVLDGQYLTDSNGHYRTVDLSLPTGHYKLFWEGRNDHNVKHKTFWVEGCTTHSPSPSATLQSPIPTESSSISVPVTSGGSFPTITLPPTDASTLMVENQTQNLVVAMVFLVAISLGSGAILWKKRPISESE